MDYLGEDLLLLCIATNGKIINPDRLKFALMGAELVRLAGAARVDIDRDRIVVKNSAPTGDPQLDMSLADIDHRRRPPRARPWVAAPRGKIVEEYANRLSMRHIVTVEPGGFFKVMRCHVLDTTTAEAARTRLDRIAQATGQVTMTDAAYAGLAYASGIVDVIYAGFTRRHIRRRFQEIAKGQWSSRAVASAIDAAASASTDAAVNASIEAASRMAIQAATDSAIQAATDAAVAAAVDATVHGATDAGGAGHSHGH